ncbi:glycoside hydrolase family 65 protein [Puniceicoccus vermicola]|uniref:Glycoside hydrolase family 65 protein n=1 Tax=Puniceicoccus vermicola TaxID=388746 RepID=A0A7X1E705_9BACT|nr:glycoside hydrolase family 65 protein [Puniceicoccus vermicola]MBC2603187.1 glycoside hydrolase family 65 protein [Puniceicoccus vermicola]
MKTLVRTEFDPFLRPAYLANGLVGLRVGQIPLIAGSALVNGYIGKDCSGESDTVSAAPYPVGADIAINGRYLSERTAAANFIAQAYDLNCGELRSTFEYAFESVVATVKVLTFCNRTMPTIVQQQVRVSVNEPCKLVLQAQLDPRGLPGKLLDWLRPAKRVDGLLQWESPGGYSRIGAGYHATCHCDGEYLDAIRNNFGHERDLQLTRFVIDGEPGREYSMQQIGVLVPSLMHNEPHLQAMRQLQMAKWFEFEKLRQRNASAWSELWKSRIRLVGAEEKYQDLLDSSFFYMHSSVNQATPSSVAPFGLSQDGYSGHVFWDAETFMFPGVLLTAPSAAKAMMEYRVRCAPQARMNAKLNGYEGLQFPWQSSNDGYEVTSYYTEGNAELHINVDIAFAMIQYVNATGDDVFFKEHAWPIVKGVADWVVSRADETDRGYEIQHVVGIDESCVNVNNNCTLNCVSKIVLQQAGEWARKLELVPTEKWAEVAEKLFVPIDSEEKWIMPHEGYVYDPQKKAAHGNFHEGIYSIEAMMLDFPFGYHHSPEVDEATKRHYMKYLHTYMGMPMAAANAVVWAAREGEPELAKEFLDTGYLSRHFEPFNMIGETAKFREGSPNENFVTAQGGILSAVILGLCGLDIVEGSPEGWAKHPIRLPGDWEAIEIDRLYARGRPFRVVARNGAEKAEISFID